VLGDVVCHIFYIRTILLEYNVGLFGFAIMCGWSSALVYRCVASQAIE